MAGPDPAPFSSSPPFPLSSSFASLPPSDPSSLLPPPPPPPPRDDARTNERTRRPPPTPPLEPGNDALAPREGAPAAPGPLPPPSLSVMLPPLIILPHTKAVRQRATRGGGGRRARCMHRRREGTGGMQRQDQGKIRSHPHKQHTSHTRQPSLPPSSSAQPCRPYFWFLPPPSLPPLAAASLAAPPLL